MVKRRGDAEREKAAAGRIVKTSVVSCTTIDHKTGEVLKETEVQRLRLPEPEPYAKLYYQDLARFFGVGAGGIRLLIVLASHMDYENRLLLAPGYRKKLTEEAGFATVAAFNNALQALVNARLVARVGEPRDGCIEVDSHMFGKGEWADIIKRRADFSALFEIVYTQQGGKPRREVRVARMTESDPRQPGLPGIAA